MLLLVGNASEVCKTHQFQCPSLDICLPISRHCDGYQDCPGGADELRCDTNIIIGEWRWWGGHTLISVCRYPDTLTDTKIVWVGQIKFAVIQ